MAKDIMFQSRKDYSRFHSTWREINKIHLFLRKTLGKRIYLESSLGMMCMKAKTVHGTYKRRLHNTTMKII